ncbi:MAG: right-handed parallel beta-helix repeat-containing protein [Xanthobacteraceae bacterium]
MVQRLIDGRDPVSPDCQLLTPMAFHHNCRGRRRMRKIGLSAAMLGGTLAILLQAVPANAQATRTWVSGVGDDVNPCSRTAPCKTFAGAISKTAVNGEINCIDSGAFGAVTITKSITIKCEGVLAGVLATLGSSGIIINDAGSATPGTAIVTLSGLDIEGAGTGANGIRFLQGASLHIHKTQIRNFRNSGGAGNGILVDLNSTVGSPKRLFVLDSYITGSGGTASNAGLLVRPTGGAAVNVVVYRTSFESNNNGVFVDGSGGAGGSNIAIENSLLAGSSGNGVAVSSTGASMVTTVADCRINSNGAGAATAGASATLRLGGNTISGNGTGVSNGGGTLQSFKNNQIAGNGADGTPLGAVNSGGNILN